MPVPEEIVDTFSVPDQPETQEGTSTLPQEAPVEEALPLEVEEETNLNAAEFQVEGEFAPEKKPLNTRASHDLATVISKTLNIPEVGYIERLLESGSTYMPWESYKQLYKTAVLGGSGQDVLDLAIKDLKQIDEFAVPDASNPNFLNILKENTLATVEQAQNPEVAAFVNALQAPSREDLNHDRRTLRLVDANGVSRVVREEMFHTAINAQRLYEGVLEVFPDMDKPTMLGMLGEALVTAIPFWVSTLWAPMVKRLELKTGIPFNLDPGEDMAAIRRAFVEADGASQKIMVDEMVAFLTENSAMIGDLEVARFVQNIYNKDVMRGDPSRTLNTFLESVFFWGFDVLPVLYGSGKALTGSLTRASGSARVTIAANKDEGAKLIVDAMKSPMPSEATTGLTRGELAATQMPKAEAVITPRAGATRIPRGLEDVPGIEQEIDRQAAVATQLDAVQGRIQNTTYTIEEKQSALQREVDVIDKTFNGRLRTGLTTFKYADDGAQVDINLTMGLDDKRGYPYLTDALDIAEVIKEQGFAVRILQSDGSKITPILADGEVLEVLQELRRAKSDTIGEFYIQYTKPYTFRPADRALFGENVVLTPSSLGRATEFLAVPDAIFSQEFYNGFSQRYANAQGVAASLKTAMFPVLNMRPLTRSKLNRIYQRAQMLSQREGRDVSYSEIRGWGDVDLTGEELLGLYTMRKTADAMYELVNEDLVKWLQRENAKTLRQVGTTNAYHGTPLERARVVKNEGKMTHALNPMTGAVEEYTAKQIDELYERNGSVLRTALEEGEGGITTYQIIFDPKSKGVWNLEPLANRVLRYEPWYYPKMYADNYAIEKVTSGLVDGLPVLQAKLLRVAKTVKEAERTIKRLNRKEKPDSGTFYRRVEQEDARFTGRDGIKMDLNRLRQEGRLIWGNRTNDRVTDAYNRASADVIDPIEALGETTRAIGNHVAFAEYLGASLQSWKNTYGHLLGPVTNKLGKTVDIDRLMTGETYRTVETALKTKVSQLPLGESPTRVAMNEALQTWTHIATMSGVASPSTGFFRRINVVGAELLHESMYQANRWVRQKAGMQALGPLEVPLLSRAVNFAVARGHEFAAPDVLKSLAHTMFIVGRPVKQLALQAAQHTLIMSVDPKYFGRLQWHSFLMMASMKRRAFELSHGRKGMNLLMDDLSSMMGMNRIEFDRVTEELFNSGLTQKINVHSILGDHVQAGSRSPASKTAWAWSKAFAWSTARPLRTLFQHLGFDTGESYNVVASYMMALRRHMIEKNVPSVGKLAKEDWLAIANRANGYSLAMDRANEAAFQRSGVAGAPLQFMSYLHKSALLTARAVPNFLGGKYVRQLGQKSITREEATRIFAGQLVQWGATAYGANELINEYLLNGGPEIRPKLVEAFGQGGEALSSIIESGMNEFVVDETLQFLFNDPELNMQWGETFAPASAFANLAKDMFSYGSDTRIIDLALGPSSQALERWGTAFHLGKAIWDTRDVNEMPDWQKFGLMYTAYNTGQMGVYTDYFNSVQQARMEQWINSSGVPLDMRAKMDELVLSGAFGVKPKSLEDYYFFRRLISRVENPRDMAANFKDLDQDWSAYTESVRKILNFKGLEAGTPEAVRIVTKAHRLALSNLDPNEVEYMNKKWQAFEKSINGVGQKSLTEQLLKTVRLGVPVDRFMFNKIDELDTLTPAQKQLVKDAIQKKMDTEVARQDEYVQFLDKFIEEF